MRVLNALSLCLALCSISLQAENIALDNYISSTKQEEFSLRYKKNEEQNNALRDSWIRPIQMRYSFNRSNSYDNLSNSQNGAIVMDQTIFQSGGIYYGIKYANAMRIYSDFFVDVQKRELIKEVISLLVQIKQVELKAKKQQLEIESAKINVEQQTQRYLSGQLDSGLLDDAIIKEIFQERVLYDIQTSKEQLISLYKAMSDSDYRTTQTPTLSLMSQEEFVKNNVDLMLIQSEKSKSAYYTEVTQAKYLPKLSISASYNWEKRDSIAFSKNSRPFPGSETDYYNYGFNITMPIDYNGLRDIESSKLDNLKAGVSYLNKKREAIALYDMVQHNLDNIDKKLHLSERSVKLYSKLYNNTLELFHSGYKTEYDVKILKNSVEIQNIEKEILKLDRDLELLKLYAKVIN